MPLSGHWWSLCSYSMISWWSTAMNSSCRDLKIRYLTGRCRRWSIMYTTMHCMAAWYHNHLQNTQGEAAEESGWRISRLSEWRLEQELDDIRQLVEETGNANIDTNPPTPKLSLALARESYPCKASVRKAYRFRIRMCNVLLLKSDETNAVKPIMQR